MAMGMKLTDEAIVEEVIQGDNNSFKYLIERYQKRIFALGIRFFKNEESASDFVQEVFIKAYTHLASYKARAPFRFWLAKIAYNHGINQISAKKEYHTPYSEEKLIAKDPSPEMVQMKGEAKNVLRQAIESLPEPYQVCVDFYFFLGLSYKQISEITKIPVNTIKSNVYRAKKLLRDHLKGSVVEEYYYEM